MVKEVVYGKVIFEFKAKVTLSNPGHPLSHAKESASKRPWDLGLLGVFEPQQTSVAGTE